MLSVVQEDQNTKNEMVVCVVWLLVLVNVGVCVVVGVGARWLGVFVWNGDANARPLCTCAPAYCKALHCELLGGGVVWVVLVLVLMTTAACDN